jgi:choline kinase
MRTHVAVVLAAGIGSRLRPLTDDRPKALVPVGGRSILSRAVDALRARGVSRLVVATGFREDAIKQALSDVPLEVVYRRNPKYETTQNSVSLALCRDALEGEAFFRLDGDVLFDPEVLSRLDSVDAPLATAVDRSRKLDEEAMKVRLAGDGRTIAAFGKGIPLADSAGESIGIERVSAEFGRSLFDGLEDAAKSGEFQLYYEDVYSRLIARGASSLAVDVSDLRWCEVDSLEDLRAAERLFAT